MIDLNVLEKALAKMSPGPWRHEEDCDMDRILSATPDWSCDGRPYVAYGDGESYFDPGDAAGIVALVNAAPALIARIRELESNASNSSCFDLATFFDLNGGRLGVIDRDSFIELLREDLYDDDNLEWIDVACLAMAGC